MKKAFISFLQVFQQIRNDPMLLAACFTPILAGILIKLGVPLLEKGIPFSLSDYYMIFDLFLSIIAPVLLCFAFAMITLEEMDDKVARYFSITPLGKLGYLLSRLGIPAIEKLTKVGVRLRYSNKYTVKATQAVFVGISCLDADEDQEAIIEILVDALVRS